MIMFLGPEPKLIGKLIRDRICRFEFSKCCVSRKTIMTMMVAFQLVSLTPVAHSGQRFISFSYHSVQDEVLHKTDNDQYAVSVDHLITHFEWLKYNGYTPVSLDDLIASQNGKKALPEKPVLLSFDDGLRNVYTRVFPLLKLYNYPAVIALVGKWMEAPVGDVIPYTPLPLTRKEFLTWEQVKEMQRSGLVEVALHSHDLHKGVIANPQNNLQTAATSRRYLKSKKRYETEAQYLSRIKADLRRGYRTLEKNTLKAPRAIVWPYGAYNKKLLDIARQLKMPITLSLDDGFGDSGNLSNIPRMLITGNPDIGDFVWLLRTQKKEPPKRIFSIDIDLIYDADVNIQKANLDKLIDYIHRFEVTQVALKATTDTDGDGFDDHAYFPNRLLPVRRDLFNRVAWQIKTRGGVDKILAEVPGKTIEKKNHLASAKDTSKLIEDLSAHSHFHGVIFNNNELIGGARNKLIDEFVASAQLYSSKLIQFFRVDDCQDVAKLSPQFLAQLDANNKIITGPGDRKLYQETDIKRLLARKGSADRIVFTIDASLPLEQGISQMRLLQRTGAKYLMFSPKDFNSENGDYFFTRVAFSSSDFPYPPE